MTRTLLFVGGGREAIPGVKKAKRMGLRVAVSDIDVNAPAARIADHVLVASTYDVISTTAAAKKFATEVARLDGVLSLATDVPLTVATVAEALDLPGPSLTAARLASDKLAMKQKFSKDEIAVPWYSAVGSPQELEKIIREQRVPLIVKPVDSRGARGVIRLLENVNPELAWEIAAKESPTRRVMVEHYLAGPQVSTESIILDDQCYTLGFSDRNYEFLDRFAPYVIENGGELPGVLGDAERLAVREVVAAAARSMGIRRGTVKGDIVIHHGVPYVIELAARLSGGYFASHEIPLNTGVDFVGAAIRLALGEDIKGEELAPRFNRPVVQRYVFAEPGLVVDVPDTRKLERAAGIGLCRLNVDVGDVLPPVTSHPNRAGVIIACGDTPEIRHGSRNGYR